MILSQRKCCQFLLLVLIVLNVPPVFSEPNALSNFPFSLKHGHATIQLGGYLSNPRHTQHVNIQDLIGDTFTVTGHNDSNALVGAGYFLDVQEKSFFKISYGVNAFYLAKTMVSGNIIQENLFTNLSYKYNLTHYPIYAIAKSTIQTNSTKYALTIDAGIGLNFMRTDGFLEHSLDGITIPNNIFSSHTTTAFSATTGFGIKINHIFGATPLECGYRLFYLGQGYFNPTTNQILNTLNTGSVYANAMMCSIVI